MKKKTPISLFSFQDIITSLTGIMIVVVLVIMLQLVESTRAMMAHAQMQPEYQMLKKVYEELVAQKEKLQKKVVANAEAADKYAEYSVEKLNSLVREEELFSNVLKKQVAEIGHKLSDLTLKNAKNQLRSDELKKTLHAVSRSQSEIRELQAQLLALQRMQQDIDNTIKRKQKMLRFEFAGYDQQTPLLIECNYWGFRCKRYPDGELVVFGTPGKGSLTRQLPQLKKWIVSNDSKKCFPVMLYREKALVFYDKISDKLYDIYLKKSWGEELISSNEEIFQ